MALSLSLNGSKMLVLGFCSGYSFWWNKEVAPFREMLLSAYHHSAHPKPVSFNLNREKKKKISKGKVLMDYFCTCEKIFWKGNFLLLTGGKTAALIMVPC